MNEQNPDVTALKRILSIVLRVVGSTLLIFLLVHYTNIQWRLVISSWSEIHTCAWMIVTLGFVLMMSLKAVRWQILIKHTGGNYSFWKCLLSYLAGYSIGIITPGRMGEFTRAAFLSKHTGLGWRRSIGSVLTDRIYDLLFLVAFGTTGLTALFFPTVRKSWPIIVIVIFTVGILFINYLSHILNRLPSRWKDSQLGSFGREVTESIHSTWPVAMLCSAAGYSVYFSLSWFIFRLAGAEVPFLDICFIISSVGIILLIPISFAGLGTREAIVVFMLGRMGIPTQTAMSASILHFFCMFGIGGIIGAIILLIHHETKPKLRADKTTHSHISMNLS